MGVHLCINNLGLRLSRPLEMIGFGSFAFDERDTVPLHEQMMMMSHKNNGEWEKEHQHAMDMDKDEEEMRVERKKGKLSVDPQSVAARKRRQGISKRLKILKRMVPGGSKMDTASMLDHAIHYVKFLHSLISLLHMASPPPPPPLLQFHLPTSSSSLTTQAMVDTSMDVLPYPFETHVPLHDTNAKWHNGFM